MAEQREGIYKGVVAKQTSKGLCYEHSLEDGFTAATFNEDIHNTAADIKAGTPVKLTMRLREKRGKNAGRPTARR